MHRTPFGIVGEQCLQLAALVLALASLFSYVAVQHAAGITVFGNAMLLFAVARTLGGAAHMWVRTRPLVTELAEHKASQPPAST